MTRQTVFRWTRAGFHRLFYLRYGFIYETVNWLEDRWLNRQSSEFAFSESLLVWWVPRSTRNSAPELTIQRIEIRGNRRISEETIRFYIQSREGEPYDQSRLESDLRALYKANFFENIEIQEKDGDIGKIITFVVKEKPLIRFDRIRRQSFLYRIQHPRCL